MKHALAVFALLVVLFVPSDADANTFGAQLPAGNYSLVMDGPPESTYHVISTGNTVTIGATVYTFDTEEPLTGTYQAANGDNYSFGLFGNTWFEDFPPGGGGTPTLSHGIAYSKD